jgi:hypothetical protein
MVIPSNRSGRAASRAIEHVARAAMVQVAGGVQGISGHDRAGQVDPVQ